MIYKKENIKRKKFSKTERSKFGFYEVKISKQ